MAIFDNLSNLAKDSDWEEINTLYSLSESDQESVREQALLLASSEAGEDNEPSVTVGHIKSVLDNFGFQPKNSGSGSGFGGGSDSTDTESNSSATTVRKSTPKLKLKPLKLNGRSKFALNY